MVYTVIVFDVKYYIRMIKNDFILIKATNYIIESIKQKIKIKIKN